MALLLIVACLAAHAERCDPPGARSNGTLNSAPLLLQRPGALVSTANRSWENTTASWAARSLHFPQIATETWSFISEGKVRTLSLEGFGPAGVHKFLNAAFIFDWCLFVVAACVAFVWRRSSKLLTPLSSLVGWYFLELIFLVENVFVFHAIAEAFLVTTTRAVSQCLVVVAWGQICFDVVFYMGLAQWLRSWVFLPYLLGHVAYVAAGADRFLVLEKQIKVPILDVVTCVLLLADFLLDIDVVLTKIEEIPNTYIGPFSLASHFHDQLLVAQSITAEKGQLLQELRADRWHSLSDWDSQAVPRSNSRTIRTFQAMVAHPGFDLFFAALVAANTLFMGIEVELSLASQSEGLASQVLGKMFTVAFTATRLWHAPSAADAIMLVAPILM
eukprot:Skav233908  [mRNA]  locus=scaffold435:407753:431166:+ [translate_table: standard]